ncbi:MAG: choline dehydrogenase [Paracoccaceae bacterium]|nr:choline dehydrogenase [Paracoccaceae bacterium]
MFEADYIIIGAGSAGCVLANRLTAGNTNKVLLVETGKSDRSPLIQMPAALSYPMNMKKYDWGFESEPEINLNNRKLATPRGKVIGGSSSINGMVFVRGHARDFDNWAQSGAKGWSYADVLPYFKRMETWHGEITELSSLFRGTSGPLHVSRGEQKNPLFKAFVAAGKEAGFELTPDYNGRQQEGFGVMEQTIHKGRRWSAANAYLKPALRRRNLKLQNGYAHHIIFDGLRAVGVEVNIGGSIKVFRARKEIILSASSINSPRLLLLSGIGPANELKRLGIQPILNKPGVGLNLQDHLEVYIQQECNSPITLFKHWNLFSKAMIGLEWLLTKRGHGASNHFESAAFIRSRPGIEYPDIQFHFLPIAIRYDGRASATSHSWQAHVGPMRSSSRGSVSLKSKSPNDMPKIRFNYMSHERDWIDFRHCVRVARDIFSQDAFKPFRGKEIQPGDWCNSDLELNEFIKEHAESAYHPCGTCKMGAKDDPTAVVDETCKVIGVEQLRVVDSSVFPNITNGNLNAPTIMVGEKASDHILGNQTLQQATTEPWINPQWESSDR